MVLTTRWFRKQDYGDFSADQASGVLQFSGLKIVSVLAYSEERISKHTLRGKQSVGKGSWKLRLLECEPGNLSLLVCLTDFLTAVLGLVIS